jgi:hypothetical protein
MGKARLILILAITLIGCRSPERLIEKALKIDSEALSPYSDTITLTRLQIDSVEVQRGDTVIWEKVVTETKYDTIIPVKQIEIEKSRTRQEVRKSHKLQMALIKLQEKESKWQSKLEQLQVRLDAKTDRVEVRHETKIVRAKSRWWLWWLIGIATAIIGRILIDKLWTKLWKI